jgi:uncharacterized protein YgbK (DUF1537 family)
MRIPLAELPARLPPEWPEALLSGISDTVVLSGQKILVLDDDPTGTQTVYDVPVLTEWSVESLANLLAEPGSLAYILTNSRSLPTVAAEERNREIARNLLAAAKIQPRSFVVVSRSDSTLRGHFPSEVSAFTDALGQTFDATLLIPPFMEGGRFTIGDTHYVREGDWLVPAAETESARDATFGYRNSNLRHWVSEKYGGQIAPDRVESVPIELLRRGGPEAIARHLEGLTGGQVCVVNAASYRDLEVFVAGLLAAEARGKRFFYRTAASFVRIRGGLAARPLLDLPALIGPAGSGGLIVAGSYVQRSSAQIGAASSLDLFTLEVPVETLLRDELREEEIGRVATAAAEALRSGVEALIFTSRQLVTGADQDESLRIGNIVSSSLVNIVRRITQRPAWVIAKGGITSSDIATKALNIKRADVLGQAFPGVPVWRTGDDSRWPGLLYVVFPGNVGETGTLATMIETLRKGRPVNA